MEKSPVFLIYVDDSSDIGNNKDYSMTPLGDGTFKATWGRVGGHHSEKIYPMSKWDSLYQSKVKKGYQDVSDLKQDIIEDSKVEAPKEGMDKFSVIKNESVRKIIKRLWEFANNTVQSSYKVTSEQVTQAMVDRAQEILDELSTYYKTSSREDFNKDLKKLFAVIPRKMRRIRDYLLSENGTLEERERILQREQDTLDAMRGMVYKPKSVQEKTQEQTDEVPKQSILDEMGIEMEDCSEEDIKKIKKLMGDSADKFYRAWRVKNLETEQVYQKFTKENKIGNVKLLCHGSRNQNWFNILKIGIKIRPSGVITTGAMFGEGAYWSNPEKYHGGVAKSINYTSLSGSYWAHGSDNCGFLAFFDVALGKSLDAYSFDSKYHSYNLKALKKEDPEAWSLWAHGNTNMLRNDEIIVYDTRQMTIRYLVEIRRER